MSFGYKIGRRPRYAARLKNRLDKATIGHILAGAVHEAGARAAMRAPVDEGDLVGSIHVVRLGQVTFALVAGVRHAPFVEFGTGQRGRATDPGPRPRGYTHGPSQGMDAQPYMRPSVKEVVDALDRLFRL